MLKYSNQVTPTFHHISATLVACRLVAAWPLIQMGSGRRLTAANPVATAYSITEAASIAKKIKKYIGMYINIPILQSAVSTAPVLLILLA
jgi:hypothetical protein